MAKRQLAEDEKKQVIEMQRETDGLLRCFISGEVIDPRSDEVEFDHIQPYADGGETSLVNIRAVLKHFNRRKADQSLYEFWDNLRLERLFKDASLRIPEFGSAQVLILQDELVKKNGLTPYFVLTGLSG